MKSQGVERMVERSVALPSELRGLGRSALQQMAFFDQLTGLPNRHALQAFFDQRIRDAEPFAGLAADVNKVKPVNDRLGHRLGDKIIKFTGLLLQNQLREAGDSVAARRGGDEFGGLIRLVRKNGSHISSPAEQHDVLDRITQRITREFDRTEPVRLYNAVVPTEDALGITLGTSVWLPDMSLEDLMDQADTKGQQAHDEAQSQWVGLAADMNHALDELMP